MDMIRLFGVCIGGTASVGSNALGRLGFTLRAGQARVLTKPTPVIAGQWQHGHPATSNNASARGPPAHARPHLSAPCRGLPQVGCPSLQSATGPWQYRARQRSRHPGVYSQAVHQPGISLLQGLGLRGRSDRRCAD